MILLPVIDNVKIICKMNSSFYIKMQFSANKFSGTRDKETLKTNFGLTEVLAIAKNV